MATQIEVHFFTSPTRPRVLKRTIDSFRSTFGEMSFTIWNNNGDADGLPHRKTESLSDGYIKAIEQSNADYLFMIEHDWTFVAENIAHTLPQIAQLMQRDSVHHLRFNKRQNRLAVWDKWLNEKEWYCETPQCSNNPHIVNRSEALKWIANGWIERVPGSGGIEKPLSKHVDGAIYGKLNHMPCIDHTDGAAPELNILIRTSNRKKQFAELLATIPSYPHLVVSCDTDEAVDYVNELCANRDYTIVRTSKEIHYNGYFAKMYPHCRTGWIHHMDDDDYYTPDAFKYFKSLKDTSKMHITRIRKYRGGRWKLSPKDGIFRAKEIQLGQLCTQNITLHTSMKMSRWGLRSGGDFLFIRDMARNYPIEWHNVITGIAPVKGRGVV
jgi:hypothetical protein